MIDIIDFILQDMFNHIPEDDDTIHQHNICYDTLDELYQTLMIIINNELMHSKIIECINKHKDIVFVFIDLETMDKDYDLSVFVVDNNGATTYEITM